MTDDSNNKNGVIIMLLATISFSFVAILAELGLNSDFKASTLLFYRFFIAFVFFIIYSIIKGYKIILPKQDVKTLLIAGCIYAIHCYAFFAAYEHIPASLGSLLFSINPVFALILSKIFLNEEITKNKVFGILIAISGVLIILYAPWKKAEVLGISMIIVSAFLQSCYLVYNKKQSVDTEVPVKIIYISAVCSFLYLAHALINKDFIILHETRDLLYVFSLALCSTIIGLLGLMTAVTLIDVGLLTVISISEPFFTLIFSFIILNAELKIQQILGGIIIAFGVFIYNKNKKAKKI